MFVHSNRFLLSLVVVLVAGMLAISQTAGAQTFTSGSDGSDGALTLTTPGTVVFNPANFDPPLDPDGDGVYHFTTITIGEGVTVKLSGQILPTAQFWLATGDIQIDGVIDASGEVGHPQGETPADRRPSVPGPGGFPGGVGESALSNERPGMGPGGGGTNDSEYNYRGAGAGHANTGGHSGGPIYGNRYLAPLLGGSGGGGGAVKGTSSAHAAGGGAGGGALLLASSTQVSAEGEIRSRGGDGVGPQNSAFGAGGAGSGGSVYLIAPTIGGQGTIDAGGGAGWGGIANGSRGRVRLESWNETFSGTIQGALFRGTPIAVRLPTSTPTVRVTSVDGVPVAMQPTGEFAIPDVVIDNGEPVPVAIEAENVPLGTTVQVYLYSEDGADQIVDSTPLAGAFDSSTATATLTIPSGYSRGLARATWTP